MGLSADQTAGWALYKYDLKNYTSLPDMGQTMAQEAGSSAMTYIISRYGANTAHGVKGNPRRWTQCGRWPIRIKGV